MWVLIASIGLLGGWTATADVARWGQRIELPVLRQHPARVTAELRDASGRVVGRYEAVYLWEVVRPLLGNVPDSLYGELAVMVTASGGRRAVFSVVEILPEAGLPPLVLLGPVRGSIGDTVRVGIAPDGSPRWEELEAAIAPAVRLRYRLQARLRRIPVVSFPALVVGAERYPRRWLSGLVRVDVLQPGRQQP